MPNYPIWRGLPGRDGAATLPAGTQGQVVGYGPDGAPVSLDLPPAGPTPTGLRVQDGKLFLDMSDGTTLEVTLPAGGTTPPAQVAPSFTSQPMLTGSTALGSTITVSLGAASGTPTPTITGSLARPGRAAAAVAHGSTFAIEAGDQGGTITLTATATNTAGTVSRPASLAVPAASQPVRAFSFPAPGARYDINFAGQQYHGGTQPQTGFSDDGRFFRPMVSQAVPMLTEEEDGSLFYNSTNGLRITSKGLTVHPGVSHTFILQNRDLTQSVWTKTGCTAVKNLTGRDKRANSASRVTVTADLATITQPMTGQPAGNRRPFLDAKRISGTGTISLTLDGGVTWEVLDLSDVRYDGWARCTLPMRAIAADAVCGLRFSTAGDVFGVDVFQLSERDYDTSPISTTTASARKPYDRPSVGAVGSNIGGTQSGLYEFYSQDIPWGLYVEGAFRDPGNIFSQYIKKEANGAFSYRIFGPNGTASLVCNLADVRPWPQNNRMLGIRDSQGAGRFCVNGGTVYKAPSGFTGPPNLNHSDLLSNGAGDANGDGVLRRLTFFDAPMTDAEMQAWTS